MTLQLLPSATVKLISSSQVITSPHSVVKELLENSLDAHAKSIEIKLENYGLDRIEVRDNGCGVSKPDVVFMAQPHYTSKITSCEDLDTLITYGFRGEALGSICAVGDVKIITKTMEDDVSQEYELNNKGQVIKSKPSHLGQGTSVVVNNLFKTVPVRKQFYNNIKRKKETIKSIEDLVIAFSISCPETRLVFRHNKEVVWQKNSVSSIREVLHTVLGVSVTNQLEHLRRTFSDPKVKIECFLPKALSTIPEMSRSGTERTFVYVNERYICNKDVEKKLKDYYSKAHNLDSPKYPIAVIKLTIPSKEVDVNLEPNKNLVLLHNKEQIYKYLEDMLEELYPSTTSGDSAGNSSNLHENLQTEMQHSNNFLYSNELSDTLSNVPEGTAYISHLHSCNTTTGCDSTRPNKIRVEKDDIDFPKQLQTENINVNLNVSSGDTHNIAHRSDFSTKVFTNLNNDGSQQNMSIQQTNKPPMFEISDGIDDILKDTNTSSHSALLDKENLASENVLEWSKGTSLLSKKGGIVEPVQLHVPSKVLDNALANNIVCGNQSLEKSPVMLSNKTQRSIVDVLSDRTCITPKPMQSSEKIQSLKKKRKLDKQSSDTSKITLFTSKKKAITNVKSCVVQFSIDKLKYKLKLEQSNNHQWEQYLENLQIISPLHAYGLWMCYHGNKLSLFQPIRAKEVLIYKRLLDTYTIPVESLASSMLLTKKDLKHWDVLVEMECTQVPPPDPYTYVSDPRLLKNGFKLRKKLNYNGVCEQFEIIAVTTCMNYYGKTDLEEILSCVSNKQDCPLALCRPLKIQHYLQAEAVRMSRQLPSICSRDECTEILQNISLVENLNSVNLKDDHCFHNKPYMLPIYDLYELPSSQFSQQQVSYVQEIA